MKKIRSVLYLEPLALAMLLLSCGVGPSDAQDRTPAHAQKVPPPAQSMALQGNTYYVATNGNDNNPGTSELPWRTIQKAASTLAAGHTVYVRAGTYHEQVRPQDSGSDANGYITYAAYPGETVTIDGAGVQVGTDEGLFYVSGQRYVRISGLRIVNSAYAGILIENSGHLIVENNHTYNTASSGIGVWSSNDVVIDGNEIRSACHNGFQECLTVAGTDTFEVKHNHVYECDKEGIDAKDGSSNGQVYRNHVHGTQAVGIYVDAWNKHTFNIDVFQNVVHDSLDNNGFSLASEAGGLLEDVRVYNNIAYHNRYLGLGISSCCPDLSASHPMTDIIIINNTFYNNGWTEWGGGILVENPDVENVVIRNNICSDNLSFQIAVDKVVPPEHLSVDHNLIDGYRGYEDETTQEIRGNDYVAGDPLFVFPVEANFHLRRDSPAIDQGSATDAPGDDYDGRFRPYDGDGDGTAAYDIGAYEEGFQPDHWVYLPLVVKALSSASSQIWRPPLKTSWQWQLADLPVDQSFDVVMYDVDLFDNDASIVAALHAQGRKVVCYVSVGSWEDWRPDQEQFPPSVIGKDYAGWPGEKWLDIRRIDLLAPLMRARFDQCQAKGFDALEPDNIDGYTNDTGFPLTYQDQLNYNVWLANEAHARGLSIGLKNDGEQAEDLLAYFDWAMAEDCFADDWCDQVAPFVAAGKAVFAAEYTDQLTSDQFLNQICPQASTLHLNAILKNRDLDAYRAACP